MLDGKNVFPDPRRGKCPLPLLQGRYRSPCAWPWLELPSLAGPGGPILHKRPPGLPPPAPPTQPRPQSFCSAHKQVPWSPWCLTAMSPDSRSCRRCCCRFNQGERWAWRRCRPPRAAPRQVLWGQTCPTSHVGAVQHHGEKAAVGEGGFCVNVQLEEELSLGPADVPESHGMASPLCFLSHWNSSSQGWCNSS